MAGRSRIEWTDSSWNPVRGCSRVSEGCRHCYAEPISARFSGPGLPFEGLATIVTRPNGSKEARWTGKVRAASDEVLLQPLRWKRPRKIFVNSMSDLFHENLPDEVIDRVFAVMALCPQHTFQILTKRPERMRNYLQAPGVVRRVYELACDLVLAHNLQVVLIAPGVDTRHAPPGQRVELDRWPLPNGWLGVSIEDQVTADTRTPYLLDTPAAVRFLSCEPLLGPIDVDGLCDGWKFFNPLSGHRWHDAPDDAAGGSDFAGERVQWVIVGGESGPDARPMHPDWARSLRDQCERAGVPFFFKQWGEWAPHVGAVDGWTLDDDCEQSRFDHLEWEGGGWSKPFRPAWCDWDGIDETQVVSRIGKKRAGRLLDGIEHSAFPGSPD